MAGLTASGADVYLLHVTTTPSVSYVARTEDFDCGIMISASHNPYYDNGIKLINGDGEKMDEETMLSKRSRQYLDGEIGEIPLRRPRRDRLHRGLRGGQKPLHRLSDLPGHPLLQAT